jgi:LysR family glycine cleavage system transcriptional activator
MNHRTSKRRLPSLNALRSFEAAARHLSFKDAASELNVSQSAVSHQIKALEEFLGLLLFERKTRAVALTRKGRLYYPILRNAFDSMAEGTEILLQGQSIAILTLQVYSTFTIRWLLPRLARFQENHTDVQIRLQTAQSDVNFAQDDVDAAIMIGQPTTATLHYDHLFDCQLYPVCSPKYLQKHGPIESPEQLASHPLIQVYPSSEDWYHWLDGQDVVNLNPNSGLQLESYDVALSSAAQGIGVALGLQPYTSRDFRNGTLVEIFPELRIANPNSWYLACRAEKRHIPKIEIFRDWLLNEVAADELLTCQD